ncbi:hypothetical protein EHI8A_067200 [Entamoeba histolytica HM-1:IMSS-B]|uniref:Gem-associated protein 2 n=6 Tax=Entamoeba histolytica TaxID=5759 RepID=C4M9Y9_ENTH1|nr:hypothetical protein EHI_131510 [Entamoeba histolytica HM-1:IMSS]EMD45446.1 Hypothetical protein EHI5A_098340 [Entamoeba histolytica KU27]EMH76741.1 hypothetical protein EHI8A_067200 [Entamoeba histolytica HM-1:IMSS-B]EMS16074.1 hypothetical protein KM1_123360 [Entamoeba histolytica HM-3:IMSS]ENY62608.1 hypothetical protein EHI7A_064310 [Entamoeba histolytica HM-1:IMSS-A]GAT98548.1 hypothetical protein CL6EHI_131510 [Entamoeba histolytica]|eukprot:XP_649379.1 hypothetical protein EHI_131510 [Entamoeba histolytica HM-1:IMSS]
MSNNIETEQYTQQSLALPDGCEDPLHPFHDIYIYLKKNDECRNACSQQCLILPQTQTEPHLPINRIPDPGANFRIVPEFLFLYKDRFISHRNEIQSIISKLPSSTYPFPSFDEYNKLIKQSPKVEYLASFQNTQIIELLNYSRIICKSKTSYPHVFLEWLYGLLLFLQSPFEPEVSATLNNILKYLCRAKHAILDPYDSSLPSYNVIIAIIGIYYGEASEDDIL